MIQPMKIPSDWREVSDAEVRAAIAEAQARPCPAGCKDRIIWLGGVSAFGHVGKSFLRPGDNIVNVLFVKEPSPSNGERE